MSVRVLLVDDDQSIRQLMLMLVRGRYDADAVANAEAAIARASETRFDVLVADVRLPGMSGIDLVERITRLQPHIYVVVVSGHATVDMAVTAMKRGAHDFIAKPFTGQAFRTVLRAAVSRSALAAPPAASIAPPDDVVATSKVMQSLIAQVDTVAPYDTSVLIIGETGTGKELIARRLHAGSARARRPFVALNCAAVPEPLLEDELFGHVRGAFTGADDDRAGRFEQAEGGTLLLDEVADMSLALQAKFLRVLQQREYEKLGSSRTIPVNVRILAATSANLERRIHQGTFRADLYYRLNVVRIELPPLRARPTEIPHLAGTFLDRWCAEAGVPRKQLAPDALAGLLAFDWPGNVRQLRNAIERAATLSAATTTIGPEHLPDELRLARTPQDVRDDAQIDHVLRDFERRLLLDAMQRAGGNKLKAAQLLGIKRTTFAARLRRVRTSSD